MIRLCNNLCKKELYMLLNNLFPTDKPEFASVPPSMQSVKASNTFTFNCTPSAANPPPSSYVFERDGAGITEGVGGPVLTVSSLQRSENSGNYTCTVTNDVGSVTIATYVNVLGELVNRIQ